MNIKSTLWKAGGAVLIFAVPLLLTLGLGYRFLSPREWAAGFLTWFAAMVLWALVRKRSTRRTSELTSGPATALDDEARKRILREIWVRKALIGVLAVVLVIGVVNAATHRAWIAILTGGGMNLLLMYVLAQKIKGRRDRLNLSHGPK